MKIFREDFERNQSIAKVKTAAEFRKHIIDLCYDLEFDTVSALTVVDHLGQGSEFHVVDNSPAAYAEMFHDRDIARLDPVMQHCKTSAQPIVWTQETYVAYGVPNIWEYQARYGYKTGIALSNHLLGGKHFFIGIDRDGRLPTATAEIEDVIVRLRQFSDCAQDVALQLFSPVVQEVAPTLTPRELEVLRWTMDGVSPREISDRMKLSDNAIANLLNGCLTKFNCTSKYHAAIKAIRFGLLG